jgi:hypothetical protein
MRQQGSEKFLCPHPVLRARRLDQGDGLGQVAPVSRQQAVNQD